MLCAQNVTACTILKTAIGTQMVGMYQSIALLFNIPIIDSYSAEQNVESHC